MGNFIGKSCHRNCPLWKNRPKWLILKSLYWLKSRLLRGSEGSSLLVHALSHFCFLTLLLTLLFFFLSCLSSLFFSAFYFFLCFRSSLFFHCSSFFVYCAQLRPFYIACHDEIYRFTLQLLLPWCGCPSRSTYWPAGCSVITTTLCRLRHVPFPEKRSFVLFSFSP